MRRLAQTVGIRAPSIYKHLDGKAALELGLVEDGLFETGTRCTGRSTTPDRVGPSAPSSPSTGRWPPSIPISTD